MIDTLEKLKIVNGLVSELTSCKNIIERANTIKIISNNRPYDSFCMAELSKSKDCELFNCVINTFKNKQLVIEAQLIQLGIKI